VTSFAVAFVQAIAELRVAVSNRGEILAAILTNLEFYFSANNLAERVVYYVKHIRRIQDFNHFGIVNALESGGYLSELKRIAVVPERFVVQIRDAVLLRLFANNSSVERVFEHILYLVLSRTYIHRNMRNIFVPQFLADVAFERSRRETVELFVPLQTQELKVYILR
jgi:hypothetical protein